MYIVVGWVGQKKLKSAYVINELSPRYRVKSIQDFTLKCTTVQCQKIVRPGLKVMFFIMIFGGIVEITFLAHIIDVDVSDLGFS